MAEGPAVKGYLQRLAATAIRPAQSIHPVAKARWTPSKVSTESSLDLRPETFPFDTDMTEVVATSPRKDAHPKRRFAEPLQTLTSLPQVECYSSPRPTASAASSTARPEPNREIEDVSTEFALEPSGTEAFADPPSSGRDGNRTVRLQKEKAAAPAGSKSQAKKPPESPPRSASIDTDSMAAPLPWKASTLLPVLSASPSPVNETNLHPQTFESQAFHLHNPQPNKALDVRWPTRQTQSIQAVASSQPHGQSGPATRIRNEPETGPQIGTKVNSQAWPSSQSRTEPRRAPVLPAPTQRLASTQPDEIHIHIGRIEVTAVHPAAAQSIPKPSRKTLSLDEYLRRDQ